MTLLRRIALTFAAIAAAWRRSAVILEIHETHLGLDGKLHVVNAPSAADLHEVAHILIKMGAKMHRDSELLQAVEAAGYEATP